MDVKRLFLPLILLLSLAVSAQVDLSPSTWIPIDTLIYNKKFLIDTRDRVLQLKQQAIATGNQVAIARAYYNEMRIADQLSEDTLYFKNSLFMDSILESRQAPPLLKAIMHVLKAERIRNFADILYNRNHRFLVRSFNSKWDYRNMSLEDLDSLIAAQFDAAIQESLLIQNTPVDELLWLSNDPLAFLFKPRITDIIFAEYTYTFPL